MAADVRSRSFYHTKRFWISTVVIGFVCVGIWYCLYVNSALQSELAAIRATGLPTNGVELNDFYVVPDGEVDSTELWLSAIRELDNPDFQTKGQHLPFIGDGSTPELGEEWEQLDEAREFVSEFNEILELVHTATDAGGVVRFPVDFSQAIHTLLPDTQESRTATRLLLLDAHIAAYDGNNTRVMRGILAMFALSDALQQEPCMISQLIRMALHAIGCHTIQTMLPACHWDDEQLAALQQAIVNARFKESIRIGLYGERAITLCAIEKMPTSLITSDRDAALTLFQLSIEAMDHPWPIAILEQHSITERLQTERRSILSRFTNTAVQLLFPATESFAVAGARNEARQRCTIVAIAAERHRLKHGQLPASLSDISTHLFPEGVQTSADLMTDPFTGQQLHYLIDETQATIYSVSEDGTDEGGQISSDHGQPPDVGFALRQH